MEKFDLKTEERVSSNGINDMIGSGRSRAGCSRNGNLNSVQKSDGDSYLLDENDEWAKV